ncbi:RES family NAD+ phosphorylase [Paraburkholderia humisilvae]|uniref:RES family NAD+ phosphorylase n=1 Tax=Paraburkholderia humisilvae TaxID=627669 RepID=UPI0031B61116
MRVVRAAAARSPGARTRPAYAPGIVVLRDTWLTEARSAVLVVPSVVARQESNVLVNPAHPDAARLVVSAPQPVIWDERLFTALPPDQPSASS